MDTYYFPNKLAHASYNLSLQGHRLIAIAFSKLTLIDFFLCQPIEVKVTASDWQDVFIESEQPYRDLMAGAKNIDETYVHFKNISAPIKHVESAKYLKGEGMVVIKFSSEFLLACRG